MPLMRLPARVLRKLARILDPGTIREPEETDDFPTWMSYAIPGWLPKGNRYCMQYAIERLPSGAPLVEIGSFCGLSTNFLAYYLRKHGRPNALFNADPWQFEGAGSGALGAHCAATHDDYRAFVMESFKRNSRMFSPNLPHAIEARSSDFFGQWRERREAVDLFGRKVRLGGPISFAYVDGDHLYEAAREDFLHCDEFLEVGGFLLFDDSPEHSDIAGWGVSRVMREVKATGRYELLMTNPNHFFVKRR